MKWTPREINATKRWSPKNASYKPRETDRSPQTNVPAGAGTLVLWAIFTDRADFLSLGLIFVTVVAPALQCIAHGEKLAFEDRTRLAGCQMQAQSHSFRQWQGAIFPRHQQGGDLFAG